MSFWNLFSKPSAPAAPVEDLKESSPITVSDLMQDLPPASPVTSPAKEEIEYLFIDENPFTIKTHRPTGTFGPLPMRTSYDKLLYGCGAAYLGGLTYGGVYGTIRGLQTAKVPSFNVRLNAILNMSTRYGPWAANSMGIMTMAWAIMDSGLASIRGETDYFNHIGAAFASGFIFKSTAGLRPAFLTGSVLASVVSSYGIYDKISSGGWTMPSISALSQGQLQKLSA